MLSEKWRINLLNGLEVIGCGTRIDRFRGRTSAELLALLVLNSHRFVAREEIAGIIWLDSMPEAGRAGLRTALASLRSQVEPPGTVANTVLLADRTKVRLSPSAFTADVLEFITASANAASASSSEDRINAAVRAVELYAGELLPGNYSEWVLEERDKLHQMYRQHLTTIVSSYRSSAQPSLAIPYAQRLINENIYDEDPYLLTMRVCIEAGQREDALRTFEQLSKVMQAEYKTNPSGTALELERVARRIPEDVQPRTTARRAYVSAAPDPNERTNGSHSHDSPATVKANVVSIQNTGLPVSLTRFFGRDTEIMHLEGLICPDSTVGASNAAPQRLITLTGTGGTGKTRLATETGRILNMQRHMPVTFVPLADVTDPGRILSAIAVALNLVVRDTDKLMDQIGTALSGKPHLLILDNVEQLLTRSVATALKVELTPEEISDGIAASTIGSLLEYSPQLCCLVTSRQSLSIVGEQEYPLQPLATPALPATPERLLDFASVKLFVDRAQLSRPEFQLTTRNADVVGTICSQLDGLPLALELAAAWSSSLSPGQILERLAQRFDLLVGRKRGRAARHASLRAALEWSFNLLTLEQQHFFCRLSVFRGGWTVQATEYVCEDPCALATLASLRDRSLIVMDEAPDFTEDLLRYRLLESLRQYSTEQLTVEESTDAKRRHLDWYSKWTSEAKSSWSGTQQQVWLHRVQIEQENIQAALEFSLNDTAVTSAGTGMRIMANLGQFWSLRGNYTDARKMFARFLAHSATQEPTIERASTLMNAGSLASFQEDWKAARELHEESLSITRNCDPLRIGSVLLSLGNVSFASGHIASAKRYYQEGLTAYETAGSIAGIASALGALGLIEMTEGDYPAAIISVRKAVELNRGQANLSGVTHHLKQLALCYARAGQSTSAHTCFAESLAGYRALKDLRGMAELFADCADVFPVTTESVYLLGAAQTINIAVSAMPRVNEQLIARCRAVLGNKVFDDAWKTGQELSTDQASGVAESVLKHEVSLALAGSRT